MSDSGKMTTLIATYKTTVASLTKEKVVDLINQTDLLVHQKNEIKAYADNNCNAK